MQVTEKPWMWLVITPAMKKRMLMAASVPTPATSITERSGTKGGLLIIVVGDARDGKERREVSTQDVD